MTADQHLLTAFKMSYDHTSTFDKLTFQEYLNGLFVTNGLVGGDRGEEGIPHLSPLLSHIVAVDGVFA